MKKAISFILLVFIPFCFINCAKYDKLVERDETCNMKWADYEAQLQRRSDLIPRLVNTVKAAAKHEKDTLTEVTEARSKATKITLSAEDLTDPAKVVAFQKAQGNLGSALSKLMMLNEKYPDLKANQNFRDFQVQLEGTENRILRARTEYNRVVKEYNLELRRVSGKAINPLTGKEFKPRVYFKAESGAKNAPDVNFD